MLAGGLSWETSAIVDQGFAAYSTLTAMDLLGKHVVGVLYERGIGDKAEANSANASIEFAVCDLSKSALAVSSTAGRDDNDRLANMRQVAELSLSSIAAVAMRANRTT